MRGRSVPTFQSHAGRRVLGAAVILAAVLLVAIAVVRPNPLKQTQTFWAEFESVQGLGSIDRDIRVGGVNVGEIGDVEREGDDARVELVLEDDPEVEVHADAHADLRPHTLFEGTAFIDLSLGSPSAPRLEEDGVIPRERTTVYVSLDEALRILRKPTREAIRSTIKSGAKTLRGRGVTGLQRTLRNSPALTRDLAPAARALNGPGGYELAGAVKGFADTVKAVATEEEDLVPLARHANTTLAALSTDAGEPLDRTLVELPGALEELQRGGPDLALVAERLRTVADNARPALPDLTVAVRDLAPILEAAPPVLRRTGPMLRQLRLIFARVADAAPSLREITLALTPGTETLAHSALPYLGRDSRLGLPTYVQLFSAFSAATGAFRGYQTEAQNPLGAGHFIRLSAYFDPAGTAGMTIPGCELIAEVDPNAAAQLESLGLCQP